MNIVTDEDNTGFAPPDLRWSAIDNDTYDGAEDSHCPIGWGATEAEAIADLKERLEEQLIADARARAAVAIMKDGTATDGWYHPEHEKLKAIRAESQICGDFIKWLEQQGWAICQFRDAFDGEWVPISFTLEKLLAQRFEIDLNKLEAEKRAMLRALNPAFAEPPQTNQGKDAATDG